jgi:hypothetical protein
MPSISISDGDIVSLSTGQKKALGLRNLINLQQSGLTPAQISYLRGFATKPVSIEVIPQELNDKLASNRYHHLNQIPVDIFHGLGTITAAPQVPQAVPQPTPQPTPNLSQKVHDLQVRYLECYVVQNSKVVSVRDFSIKDGKIIALFKALKDNGNLGPLQEKEYSDDLFDYTLPKLGFVNHGLGVILIERQHKKGSPAKYRRALRFDTLKMVDLCRREKGAIGIPDYFNTDEYHPEEAFRRLAYELFFQVYPSFQESLNSVLNLEKLASAFSSTLAIKLDSSINKVVLHKNLWAIGEWSDKDQSFIMYVDTFNKDLIKYNIPFIGV